MVTATATVCGLSERCAVTQTGVWPCCEIACGRSREPVVSDVAHTHVCFRSTKSPGSRFRFEVLGSGASRRTHVRCECMCCYISIYISTYIYINMQRTRDRCLCTHMCVAETRNRWSCFRLPFVLMFECGRVCDFTQMCVADACRRVYCGRGCCCELDACHFFACKNTYAHAHARACLRSKQKTQGLGQ